jgi:hypothetical protein
MLDKKERKVLFDRLNYLQNGSTKFEILETWVEFPLVRHKLYRIGCRLPYEDLPVSEDELKYIEYVERCLEVIQPHVEVMPVGGQDFDNDVEDALVLFETVRRDYKETLDNSLEV